MFYIYKCTVQDREQDNTVPHVRKRFLFKSSMKIDKTQPVGMYYSGRFKSPPATSCGSGGCGSHKKTIPLSGCGGGSGGGCGR